MRGERRTGLRGLVVVASVLTVLLGFGSTALAQIPTLPSTPALPPQVQNTIDTVETSGSPEIYEKVSFSFNKIEVQYVPQGKDGLPQGGMTFSDQWSDQI